jgi:hypothetical protein
MNRFASQIAPRLVTETIDQYMLRVAIELLELKTREDPSYGAVLNDNTIDKTIKDFCPVVNV